MAAPTAPLPPAMPPADAHLLLAAAAEAEAGVEPGDEAEVETRQSTVSFAQHGLRLDKLLVALAPEFSRSWLQQLIDRGHVQLDGQVQTTAARKVKVGQRLQVALAPTAESLAFRPEAMTLDIVYEDAHLLVINKPVGLVVHPAPGNWSGTLLNGLLAYHLGAASLPRAGIVHRLDKDTSGLMVVAKTLPAMTSLVRQIAAREVRRVYLALAHGRIPWESTTIEAPIGRDPTARLRMAVVHSGKPARTDVDRLAVWEPDAPTQARGPAASPISAVRCRLHTGRTHQIRVHMASRGHPLVGDTLYGGRPMLGLTRQALHAAELAFDHPEGGEQRTFEAPLPDDLAAAWVRVVPS